MKCKEISKPFYLCPHCIKFESQICPYPDSDMRGSKCNHYKSKRDYYEII